ncbi:MAG TPA: hypothetical protein VE907_02510 [Gammaproteobacteria bacterium]|nr:hypothetical protein [Gammaproteobacteria bacterium]
MATLLKLAAPSLALAALAGGALAADGDRHQVRIEVDAGHVAAHSDMGSWLDDGLGKLRYSEDDGGLNAGRVFLEYRGRIAPTLSTTIVADYVDDASAGLGLTEAYLEWRPIPASNNQHKVRAGAFYPPLSLENTETGWHSPFSYSYSAIDTWLGEEIRPIGVEWSMRRRLGFAGSPHELRVFAAGFYGNDPAGTLLWWRGWSMHDRQSRLNDELPLTPLPIWNFQGVIVGYREQYVEPFQEIDHEPGAYAGIEWRYARRVLLQLARYDNRADPNAFAAGYWGWHTAFTQVGVQLSLPWELGLLAQWLDGETYWIAGSRPDGTLSPVAALVEDGFESKYLMLSRAVRGNHRFSVRYDDFEIARKEGLPAIVSDEGHAWTFAYRYERSARLSAGLEWLRMESRRDLWRDFYAAPASATEWQLRLQMSYRVGMNTAP